SPTGKYVYARISEFGSDPIYESHNFFDTETGEVISYTDLEFNRFYQIDEHGNVFVYHWEDLYIYSIPNDTVYRIPVDYISGADRYVLSADGKSYILVGSEY